MLFLRVQTLRCFWCPYLCFSGHVFLIAISNNFLPPYCVRRSFWFIRIHVFLRSKCWLFNCFFFLHLFVCISITFSATKLVYVILFQYCFEHYCFSVAIFIFGYQLYFLAPKLWLYLFFFSLSFFSLCILKYLIQCQFYLIIWKLRSTFFSVLCVIFF